MTGSAHAGAGSLEARGAPSFRFSRLPATGPLGELWRVCFWRGALLSCAHASIPRIDAMIVNPVPSTKSPGCARDPIGLPGFDARPRGVRALIAHLAREMSSRDAVARGKADTRGLLLAPVHLVSANVLPGWVLGAIPEAAMAQAAGDPHGFHLPSRLRWPATTAFENILRQSMDFYGQARTQRAGRRLCCKV